MLYKRDVAPKSGGILGNNLHPTTSWLLLGFILSLPHANTIKSIAVSSTNFTFAVIPKSLDNPFFNASHYGCIDAARVFGVECLWIGPEHDNPQQQANVTLELIRRRVVDGLAISINSIDFMTPVIAESVAAGIPVVTFDSDAPNSARSVYIGTDNAFFGSELGKVLQNLKPNGGTFAVVAGSAPNLQVRGDSLISYLNGTGKWKQLANSPSDCNGNPATAVEQLKKFATQQPTALLSVLGAPMRSGKWKAFVNEENQARNITLVCADAMPNQLAFLDQGYVDGLVGQLPYEMGYHAIEELYKIKSGMPSEQKIIGTNVLIHLRIPLILPPLIVNSNVIGNLVYVGYILFGLIATSAFAFACWTWLNRNARVVTVSQPLFLVLVALGVLIMASTLLPMSQDDSGREVCDSEKCTAICMSVPWLGFLGFTITFTALFAKTWRINRIFKNKVAFGRVKITTRDVLTPLVVLLIANTAVLICWTVIDPLTYIRRPLAGTDGWNRVIATYGSCHSRHTAVYLIPLGILNVGVMLVANWQAFEARAIQSEFSESKYISIAIASMVQAVLIGVPTLFVVRKSPEAYYLIITFMVFVISMAVLMLIFLPKIVIHQNFQRLSPADQRRLIRDSIRLSHAQYGPARRAQLYLVGLGLSTAGPSRPLRNNDIVGVESNEYQEDSLDESMLIAGDSMLAVDTSHEDYTRAQQNSCIMEGDLHEAAPLSGASENGFNLPQRLSSRHNEDSVETNVARPRKRRRR